MIKYESPLSLRETEKAIKLIKDFFQVRLGEELNLQRVSAPLFLKARSGINDDLNGVESRVEFTVEKLNVKAEVPMALTKWKRMALARYGFKVGEGLYTDMNAIRPSDELDNFHSVYVDQWDWEKIIQKEDRKLECLKETFSKIFKVCQDTEERVQEVYPKIKPVLPNKLTFVHTEDLVKEYPDKTPTEREYIIAKKYKAVFLIGIGGELPDGTTHDGRAPDYDDWTTPTYDGKKGLNGDLIFWHPLLEKAIEISSGGIRVDSESMIRQLKIRNVEKRTELEWHKKLLTGEFPQTIGSGIGQSRLCMFFLRKAHIGEVQAGIWPEEMKLECKEKGIALL